jgi:hypothetical protein
MGSGGLSRSFAGYRVTTGTSGVLSRHGRRSRPATSATLAERSAWCPAISVTTDPPLCVPAAVARRADLQLPEKLGILVLRIGVVQMRSGQKLIRPDRGEGAVPLRISQVSRHGPSWGAGWWGAGRLAACHCGLQHPNLTAIKAGPFHHAAITERPQHVPERTPLSGRRPPGRQLNPGRSAEGAGRAARPGGRRNGARCLPDPVGAVVFNGRVRRPWTNRGPATRDRRA